MPNKTITQLDLPADVATGDFLPVWDTSAATTNKIYINDINNLPGVRYNNRFYDILVDRNAWISGVIAGDTGNQTLKGLYTSILGGSLIMVSGDYSSIAGGERCRLSGTNSFIGGGLRNVSSGIFSTMGGGANNTIASEYGVLDGGSGNVVSGAFGFIGGGKNNRITGTDSVVMGGDTNINDGRQSVLVGGSGNRIFFDTFNQGGAVIVGGKNNQTNAAYSAILGGSGNKVTGNVGTVLGGAGCVSSGEYSVTMGQRCEAWNNGAVMFGDSTSTTKRAYGADSLTFNFSGGTWVTGGGLNASSGFNLNPTGSAPTTSIGGRSGDFAYRDDYLYVFTGDNTNLANKNWGRVKLSALTAAAGGQSIVSNKSSIVIPGGSPYVCTNAFANVTHAADPWNPIGQNASISVPVGNFTYLFDCQFLTKGGAGTLPVHYRLWNTTDSALINNSSGNLITHSAATIQIRISTIVTLNYVASKTIDLQAFDADNTSAQIIPTGGFLRYIVLE